MPVEPANSEPSDPKGNDITIEPCYPSRTRTPAPHCGMLLRLGPAGIGIHTGG